MSKHIIKERFINFTGLCNTKDHYMFDPLCGLDQTIVILIKDKYYFTIHIPRKTGKTSLLWALMEQINAEGNRISLYFAVEIAGYRSNTVNEANKTFNFAIIQSAKSFLFSNITLKIHHTKI